MENSFANKIRDKHELIFKIIIFLLAVVFIVFLFPREGKFKYEYQKTKTWEHEDLIAPFDFAIQKTKQEIENEKTSLRSNSLLYFKKIINSKTLSLKKFEALLKEQKELKRESYLINGRQFLNKIYDIGVFNDNDQLINYFPIQQIILLNDQNIGEEIEFKALLNQLKCLEAVDVEFDNADTLFKQLLKDVITDNVVFDDKLTTAQLSYNLSNISLTSGGIVTGQKIISKGEIVTDSKFMILESLKYEFESKIGKANNSWWILLGQFLVLTILFFTLFIFLKNVSDEVYKDSKNIVFIISIVITFVSLSIFTVKFTSLNTYIIPFCTLPILVRTFFGNRVALFTYLITIITISFIAPNPYEFILIELIAGTIALYTILNVNKRSEIFFTAFTIFISYSVIFIGISILNEGDIFKIKYKNLSWFGISAGLTVLSYPFIYIIEKIFGYVSDVTLLELSDTNNELLRELNLKAPGTFQHSIQVANIAEEAIREIGGNPLLVRTGALYHDIGKMLAPAYFIENQSSGINPHDDLNYEESAPIIISHVINGIEIAKKHQLPEQIIDFIRTHHGTTKTQYFLRMFEADNPNLYIDDNIFKYTGPIPFTKETAVLMMADSVEAASRSLNKYTLETISDLVNSIIDSQVNENQFINSPITFKDITIVKKLIIKKLMNIYHVRVEYPK